MSAEVIGLKSWAVIALVHVYPERDRIEHDLMPGCVCEPEQSVEEDENRIVFTHHALDGRKN